MEKGVIYARVSSREQEETGYSLPSQEKLLTEYALRKSIHVVKKFSVAESASGSKQRKVFAEMMDYMEKNGVSNLLCEKVDRLTRNLREAVFANDWVEKDDSRTIHFVKQNLVIHRNSKSDEKFRWDMEIVLAKKYISNLSEEVKKGQKEKLNQGWLPSRPPLGYLTIGEKGHKTHIIDLGVAPMIKRAFEYYASGNYSLKALSEKMHAEGLRNKTGRKVGKSIMHQLLKNPFYSGSLTWNDLIYAGKHEPIISKDLFNQVQKMGMGGKTPAFTRHSFTFRKKMQCGECGGSITAEIQKGHVYYHCNHYKKCSQKAYTREEEIEAQIKGVFEFFEHITPTEAEQIKKRIKQNHQHEIEYKETAIATLQNRYNTLQKRLDILYDDRLDEKITAETWEKKQKEIVTEQEETQANLKRLKSEEARYFEVWLNILDLAFRAREIYEKRSPEQKRILLSHIFSNLVLTNEKITPTLKKPVEKIAKRVQEHLDKKNTFEPKKRGSVKRQRDSFESLSPALLRDQDSNLEPTR